MRAPGRPLADAGPAACRADTPCDGHARPRAANGGHALLQAVRDRLQDTRVRLGAGPRQARASLLACADALDQIHAILLGEEGRQRRLQDELVDLRQGLVLARSALAGERDDARRARHAAQHDALTSLPNRAHFLERLRQALAARGDPRGTLAVLYIDLDDFKPVNDRHGHAVGDELLRIVATRLARQVRVGDLVSRLGGDEFACLIVDLPDPAGLESLARKLVEVFAAPVSLGALELRVRASIGIALGPADAGEAEALLRCADAAMYRAKRARAGLARFDRRLDDPERVGAPSCPPA